MLQVGLNFPNIISIVGILAHTCLGMVDLAHNVVLSVILSVIFHCLVGSVYLVVTQFLWLQLWWSAENLELNSVMRWSTYMEQTLLFSNIPPQSRLEHYFFCLAISSWNCQFINSCSITDYFKNFTNLLEST